MSESTPFAPGETVVYRARLHPIVLASPLVLVAGGLALAVWQPLSAIALLLAGAVGIVGAYISYVSTEILITDRRVIYKSGILARRTIEMNKDKIESIDVSESILGRFLDFGAVTVKGTGGGIEAIRNVATPFELRNHVAAKKVDGPFVTWLSQQAET